MAPVRISRARVYEFTCPFGSFKIRMDFLMLLLFERKDTLVFANNFYAFQGLYRPQRAWWGFDPSELRTRTYSLGTATNSLTPMKILIIKAFFALWFMISEMCSSMGEASRGQRTSTDKVALGLSFRESRTNSYHLRTRHSFGQHRQ